MIFHGISIKLYRNRLYYANMCQTKFLHWMYVKLGGVRAFIRALTSRTTHKFLSYNNYRLWPPFLFIFQ